MANMTRKELEASFAASRSFIEAENELLKEQHASLSSIWDIKKKTAIQSEIIQNNEKLISEMQKAAIKANKDGNTIHGNTLKAINKEIAGLKKTNEEEQKKIDKTQKRLNLLKNVRDFYIGQNLLAIGFVNLLNQQDKIIRQTILSLGLSGGKAEQMRASFEGSAMSVAQLGGTLQDIADIQTGFADETGRARVMTKQMVLDIAEMGLGTKMTVVEATKLAAQFEIMGIDARKANTFTQGIVDTSERMGVNTSNVFKKINEHFKKLNTYSFATGVRGMGQMAMYAEKFKVDMNQALNAADIAKSLEGAIDLAANLQIMGGEFAKTDPFEMLFLSRNDPAKFTEKISDMTKGLITFRKMSDGTFEKFISPADRDRLTAVSKSLGMDVGTLTEMAQRTADIQKMRREMSGVGLSSKEKELIEGAAIFNSKTGKFEVQIADKLKQLSELTKNDAMVLAQQTSSLNDRAKNAMDFETAFKATVESFKSILLPMLRGFNTVMEWVRPVVETIAKWFKPENDWSKTLLKVAGAFTAAAIVLSMAVRGFTQSFIGAGVINMISGKGFTGGAGAVNPMTGKVNTMTAVNRRNGGIGAGVRNGSRVAARNSAVAAGNAGKGLMNGGIGIGAAALGIGVGIGAAAAGVSMLADSLNKLDDKKTQVLKDIVYSLGGFVVVGSLAGAALIAFSGAAGVSSPAIFQFGVALGMVSLGVLGIGAGIGLATAGIGYMINALANLNKVNTDSLSSLSNLKIDSTSIDSLKSIAKLSGDFSTIGNAFNNISTVLSGNREDFEAIEKVVKSIAGTSISNDSVLGQLSRILNKPLKVEFADKNLSIATNITLEIDGEKFVRKTVKQNAVLQIING